MAWYNPGTWFQKPLTTTVTDISAPVTTVTQTPTGPVTTTTPSKPGKTVTTIYGGGSTSSGVVSQTTTPAPATYSTTADTGTGYNPATNVSEASEPTSPSFQLPKLASIQTVGTPKMETYYGQSMLPAKVNEPFFTGLTEEIKQHPYRTLAYTGIGAGIGIATGGIGLAAGAVGWGGAATFVGEGIAITAPVIYGGYTASRISAAPEGFKLETAGRITGGEVLPFMVGGAAGSYVLKYGQGFVSTWGRKEIPQKDIIPSDVLSGKQVFPSAKPSEHMNLFLTQSQRIPGINEPTVYHTTGTTFWNPRTLEVKYTPAMETSETRGLFGSYGASPYFARTGTGVPTIYNAESVFSAVKPGTAAIVPTKLVPGWTAQPGQAFVPGSVGFPKREVQAIFPIGTKAVGVSQEYYYSWKGIRIPIDVFKAVPSGQASTTSTAAKVIAYSGTPSSSIVPSSSGLSAAMSSFFKPGKASSYTVTDIKSSPIAISSNVGPYVPKSIYTSGGGSSISTPPPSSPIISSPPKSIISTPPVSPTKYTPPSSPKYTPPSTPAYVPPYIPGGDMFGKLGVRIFKGKQRKKYTPDYPSLVFGTRGKAPKGFLSGEKRRPIPKGYSFAFKESPIGLNMGSFGKIKMPKISKIIKRFKKKRR